MGHLSRALMAGTALALATTPAHADPLSIGVAILVNLGYSGSFASFAVIGTVLGSAVLGGAAIGLSLLSNALFAPQQANQANQDSERQVTVRQTVGPRLRYYGRVKVGGTLWFFENRNGYLYTATTINEGQIEGVVETWLNDDRVNLNDDGFVQNAPYYLTSDRQFAQVLYKNGSPGQTVFSELLGAFPDVITQAHRNRGVALGLTIFEEVEAELIPEVYPQLNPSLRSVIDASLVRLVRTGATAWSDNNADVIYDFLRGVDGAGFPYGMGLAESEVDLPSFQTFADICDVPFPKKGGGVVSRYRLNGGYGMNEENRAVLPRMLVSCDADLYLTSEGKVAIRGGEWIEPVLTLTDNHIISAEFRKGAQANAAFNELTITYVEPALDYQQVEAERWVDSDNIALRGRVLTEQIDLAMVSEHAQARRLGKIFSHKNNPEWSGRIVTNFYGFNALGETTIRLQYSPLGIDTTFLVRRVAILPDLTGCEITITSLTAAAYEWDADLEEGTGPASPPDTSTPIDLPPPEDFAVSIKNRTVSGATVGLYIEATWTEPDRVALSQEVQYRELPSGDWFNMSVSDTVGIAESGIVNEGSDYDVRIRTRAPAGTVGPWSDPPLTINAS